MGTFFQNDRGARNHDHVRMMKGVAGTVNGANGCEPTTKNMLSRIRYKALFKKIAGPIKARLRYWPMRPTQSPSKRDY
jgi:hypothetical protein